jgi:hydroxymethylglutaryl-CoA lyase
MSGPNILIQEVAPRDGLQIEPRFVETVDKVQLINDLSTAGFTRIEVSSFVSARSVPALRDAAEVFAAIHRQDGTVYVALVPNLRGANAAIAANADELNFVMSASETHNRANMGMTHAQSLAALEDIVSAVRVTDVSLNATVATAFGCPFEGPQSVARISDIVKRYLDLGVDGVTLADTTGMANPQQVRELAPKILQLVPAPYLTVHFHNTRGLGLLNVVAASEAGIRRFDAALGGLGGCPFAPGASGNVCTEDLVNLCHETGICTGLDLEVLMRTARRLPALIGHDISGQVAKAGRPQDLHPIPEKLLSPT